MNFSGATGLNKRKVHKMGPFAPPGKELPCTLARGFTFTAFAVGIFTAAAVESRLSHF